MARVTIQAQRGETEQALKTCLGVYHWLNENHTNFAVRDLSTERYLYRTVDGALMTVLAYGDLDDATRNELLDDFKQRYDAAEFKKRILLSAANAKRGYNRGGTPAERRAIRYLSRAWTYKLFDRVHDMLQWTELTPVQWQNAMSAQKLSQPPFDLWGIAIETDSFQERFYDAYTTRWSNAARYDALRVALALKDYKKAHGAYPGTLDALVPDLLDAVPIDPFSGLPIQYVRSGDGYQINGKNGMLWRSPK